MNPKGRPAFCVATACAAPRATSQPTHTPAAYSAGSAGINAPDQRDKPYLILISLDGFKPGYLDTFDLPGMRRLAQRGVRASALIPVFPSLTFPNHYSLVTGLHPEGHGIVSNTFYDPMVRATYSLSNREAVGDARWYRGEPIWVTAEKQGMVAACYFWPGSEAPIGGVRPTMWRTYDAGIGQAERVRTVVEWLRRPTERRPHVITLYFSELDSASHSHPLESPAIEEAARSIDRSINQLVDAIDASPIRDRIYLLLTSDHGMAELTPERELALAPLVDMADVEHAFGGPVANLHVRGGAPAAARVRDSLNARLTNGRAYIREELPERFHYRADPRAGDVVVVMDEGWTLITGLRRLVRPFRGRRGMHGWDPALPSLQALFVAVGPGIRAGAVVGAVHNVDVYPFMTELLGLRPASPLDGRAGRIYAQVMAPAGRVIDDAQSWKLPAHDPATSRAEASFPKNTREGRSLPAEARLPNIREGG